MSIENKGVLWLAVMQELQDITGEEPSSDDEAMSEATAQDLALWADDLEARVGLDVDGLREALRRYCRKTAQDLIAHEFRNYTDVLHLPDVFPMSCEAWHNDTCPVFRYAPMYTQVEFWCDYADPAKREMDGPRFTFIAYPLDAEGEIDAGNPAFEMQWEELNEAPADIGAAAQAFADEDDAETMRAAQRFITLLRKSIGPRNFAEMRDANRAETNADVCHSHDYCDANMVMHEALNGVDDIEKFNAVWNLARHFIR